MKRIILICTGNICRSPMAERLLQALADHAQADLQTLSMGTHAPHGQPAHPLAIAALREQGLALGAHRSQALNPGLLLMASDILVMEPVHQEILLDHLPQLQGRIELLGRFDPLDDTPGIEDPLGGSLADFVHCRDRLHRSLNAWLSHTSPETTGGV